MNVRKKFSAQFILVSVFILFVIYYSKCEVSNNFAE